MSDIRKAIMARLGEFSRPGAKTEMAKFNSGDTVVVPYGREMVRGKIVRYDEPAMAYVVDIGRYESIKVAKEDVRKASMSRPGAKAKFADGTESFLTINGVRYRIVGTRKDAKGNLVYDLHGTSKTAHPVPFTLVKFLDDGRWVLWGAHGGEVARGKIEASRPGAKAKMARWEESHAEGWGDLSKTLTATINGTRWTIVVDASTGKGQLMRSTGRGPQVVKEGAVDQLKRYAETAKSSRPGAKAVFSSDQVAFFLDALASQVIDQKDLAKKNAQSAADYVFKHGTDAQIKRFVQLAERVGLRVNMSRPGAKAEMANHIRTVAEDKEASRRGLRRMIDQLESEWQSLNNQPSKAGRIPRMETIKKQIAGLEERLKSLSSRPGAKSTNALSDACWQGYEAVGTKKQDGKTVPNCVPKATAAKPESQDIESEEVKAGLKLMEKADEKVSEKIRTLIKEGKPQDQAVAIALDMKRRGEL